MRSVARRFAPGDRIRVRTDRVPGHVRTPFYLRGKRGEVAEVVGDFRNPEQLAYHRPGLPLRTLYRVRFAQADLWPGYADEPGDALEADLYDHWLNPEPES